MKRRDLLLAASAALTALHGGTALADLPRVRTMEGALAWLETLEKSPQARSTGAWPLGAMLEHMAQSVEMSMDGFPQPHSALFQQTAGAGAFAFFKWRGRMSHKLSEPIPGAPPLRAGNEWRPAAARLKTAILRFGRHTGPLRPHFAYGALDKADFALAHAMHIANHQDEVVTA